MLRTNASIQKLLRFLLCAVLCTGMLSASLPLSAQASGAQTGVTTSQVVLRKSASTQSKALQTIPEGEEVEILNTSGSWYRVRYASYKGYLMKKYVKTASDSSASTSSQIKALGSAPGIMRVGDSNTDVKKLQQALEILGYYSGKIDGIYGEGTTAAVKAYQKAKGLTADGYAGERTVKSIFGSCSATSLTTQAAPTASGSSVADTVSSISQLGSAPATSKPGDSGTKVVKLQQALECLGYYSGAIDGQYGEATTAAVKKFQSKRNMKADGIAGPSTIRVLFGEEASDSSSSSKTYKTEVLDWFDDKVTSVIPKNARFTIKDVATGKTFEAVRWSGANHLDAEPRTAEDAATMKSIYGGSWSWRRRAILILYNGHVYAASMNGMPHGTSTISGNNFDGHFCIHFKNSKTHGTSKVDSEHQNAVTKASKATW